MTTVVVFFVNYAHRVTSSAGRRGGGVDGSSGDGVGGIPPRGCGKSGYDTSGRTIELVVPAAAVYPRPFHMKKDTRSC